MGPKVVKFHFNHSKLSKRPFVAKNVMVKCQIPKSREAPWPRPSDTHASLVCVQTLYHVLCIWINLNLPISCFDLCLFDIRFELGCVQISIVSGFTECLLSSASRLFCWCGSKRCTISYAWVWSWSWDWKITCKAVVLGSVFSLNVDSVMKISEVESI